MADVVTASNAIDASEAETGVTVLVPTTTDAAGPSEELQLLRLPALMRNTEGRDDIVVALLDGPVRLDHPDLAGAQIRLLSSPHRACASVPGAACVHGTFTAGIIAARRGARAPAVAPGCTVLVRPIFEDDRLDELVPRATPDDLAEAILEALRAGAQILNLSAVMMDSAVRLERALQDTLDYALRRGAIVVAATGNESTPLSSAVTRHPAVIPVVGYGNDGRLLPTASLSASTGRRGIGAPAADILSLDAQGGSRVLSGTSFAAALVSGAIALLWSEFPQAGVSEIRAALRATGRRNVLAPPLLDASAAWTFLAALVPRRGSND